MMDEGGEFKVPSLVNTAGGAKKRSSATTGDLLSDAEARKAASGEVKRLLAQLERAFLDNSEQRLAFADDASRFLPSELALDDAVKQLELIASHPTLYPLLVANNTAESLHALLAHDNSDIANDVVHVLVELTDPDVILESKDNTLPFVRALLDGGLLPTLVSHIARLLSTSHVSADHDTSAVFDALGIVENLVEVEPIAVCGALAAHGEFVPLLLRQLGGSATALTAGDSSADRTRMYAAELLSIVLQQAPPDALERCITAATVDALLTALAQFRREPLHYGGPEGPELAANLFNALCSVLLRGGPRARRLVNAADGLQLLLMLARPIPSEKAGDNFKRSDDVRVAAVRALEYAMTGLTACLAFVDLQGIGTLAKYIVGSDKTKPKQRRLLTLRATMLLAALLRQLAEIEINDDDDDGDDENGKGDSKGKRQERENALTRVLAKLLEPDKLGALVAQHVSLYGAVAAADREVALAMRVKELNNEEITEELEDEWYSLRLDAGLFELQQTDLVLALVATQHKAVVVAALQAAQVDPTLLAEILTQFAQSDADNEDDDNEDEENKNSSGSTGNARIAQIANALK